MPEYRFTTDDGQKVDHDDDPHAFKNDKAAADAAQQALAGMANDALPDGSSLDLSATVENAKGEEIYHATLKFRGETADQARTTAAEIDAGADDAADAVARALDNKQK